MSTPAQDLLFPDALAPVMAPPALLFCSLDDIQERLLAWMGPPPPREIWDPLTQVIYSLCSSRTKDAESIATMRLLREQYDGWPTGPNSWDEVRWERLRDAPVAEIEQTLHLVTFPERKAPQLKQMLQQITDRTGALSLQFLAKYRTDKIRTWLEQLPGVGTKASAAAVNFTSLRRPAIAIDGHHQRIAIRLGVVAENATARQVEEALLPLAPVAWTPATMDEHHTLVKRLGQQICPLHEPRCHRCPLHEICITGQRNAPGATAAPPAPERPRGERVTTD